MKLPLLILLLCSFLNGSSQKPKDDCKKMIDSAIYIKANALYEYSKKQNEKNPLNNLYLINENDVPYVYASKFPNTKFKYIHIYSQESKKILKEGIYAWKILTSLQGNKFTITIIDFRITYKNGKYNYANGGGSKTEFQYSCGENKWILIESKSSGI